MILQMPTGLPNIWRNTMPIYSHQCECGKCVVDNIYKNREACPDEYTSDCEACGKKKVKFTKIMSLPSGFRIQGGGVYKPTSSFD